jgi:hypothetical protein
MQEATRALLALVPEQHNMGELMTAYAFRRRLALLEDDGEEASQWLELAGEQMVLSPELFTEDPPMTKAWLWRVACLSASLPCHEWYQQNL